MGVKQLIGGGPRVEEGEGGEDEGGYYGRDNTCVLWEREEEGGREERSKDIFEISEFTDKQTMQAN